MVTRAEKVMINQVKTTIFIAFICIVLVLGIFGFAISNSTIPPNQNKEGLSTSGNSLNETIPFAEKTPSSLLNETNSNNTEPFDIQPKSNASVILNEFYLEEPEVFPIQPDPRYTFLVYQHGSNYVAFNGRDGEIAFKHSNASILLNTTIQAAGDSVFIGNGIYQIDATVFIAKSNITIIGESRDGTILRATPNLASESILMIYNFDGKNKIENIELAYMTLDGTNMPTYTNVNQKGIRGLLNGNAYNISIHDLKVINTKATGLIFMTAGVFSLRNI